MADISKIKLPDNITYDLRDSRVPSKEDTSNKVNTLSGNESSTTKYPSAKAVADAIGAINQFKYEIYASTSAVTSPKSNVLYLIGPTGSGSDKYEEYVYSNNAWIKIGDTTIDLSSKQDISDKVTSLSSSSTDVQYPSAKCVYDIIDTILSNSPWENGTGTNSAQLKNSDSTATGNSSIAEGSGTQATAIGSHTEGLETITGGTYTSNPNTSTDGVDVPGSFAHAEGRGSIACGDVGAHAEGNKTLASGRASHAEGNTTIASGSLSHSEGSHSVASGGVSHAEGQYTIAVGNRSHSEGLYNVANGNCAHVEGTYCFAKGTSSHSEGGNVYWNLGTGTLENGTTYTAVVSNTNSFYDIIADSGVDLTTWANAYVGTYLLCGNKGSIITACTITATTDSYTFVLTTENEIFDSGTTQATLYLTTSIAAGTASHAEGGGNVVLGNYAHSEGRLNTVVKDYAHTEGYANITKNSFEHAQGQYNVSNKANTTFGNAGNTIDSIGIGTSPTARKNAFEVMQNGDIYVYGLGSYNGTSITNANTLQNVINDKPSYSNCVYNSDNNFDKISNADYYVYEFTSSTSAEYLHYLPRIISGDDSGADCIICFGGILFDYTDIVARPIGFVTAIYDAGWSEETILFATQAEIDALFTGRPQPSGGSS